MKRHNNSKHLPYFKLLEALKLPGCPICRLIISSTRRYFDNLLYESVTDAGFRRKWRQNKGFCHRHSWILAESGNALGLGILYLDLLKNHNSILLNRPTAQPCSICIMEIESLKRHIGTLVDYWSDADIKKAVESSEGFCGPHLRFAKKVIDNTEIYEKLEKISSDNLNHLIADLEQLIDSFDYRHSPPDSDSVKFAWRRAIEKIVGCRELSENNK